MIEDQRDGKNQGESKGPQMENSRSKRREQFGQISNGQKNTKRAKMEQLSYTEEDFQVRFTTKKSEVPKRVREEIVEQERSRNMNMGRGALEDCQREDLETPGLAENPERPIHCKPDPLTNGLGIGAQSRINNRLNLHGRKEK